MILKKRFPLKKLYFLLVAILLTLIPLTFTGINIYCAESSENEIELELKDTIEEQLGSLDLSALNKFFDEYCQDKIGIFGETSLIEKIKKIINGEFSENSSSVLNSLLNVAFEEVLAFLPLISSIIAIAVLGSLLVELKGSSRSLADIVHFVCFGLIIIIIMGSAGKMISLCGVVLGSMQTQMEIMFPLLLTLLTAIGGTVSVAVYQPAVALLTSSVTTIFSSVLLPIFIFALTLTIISNLSNNIKLDKLAGFMFTLFKWIIGIVFTIFMGFLAIQGITAGSVDTVSFKTARYSLSTYIPIVGGYLSEGLNLILASSLLIKNAIGSCGLLIMLSTVLVPCLQIIIFMFVLKFVGAILQPLSDNRISNFISGIGKLFIMPIVMILAVTFMYVVFVGIIMCTSVGL